MRALLHWSPLDATTGWTLESHGVTPDSIPAQVLTGPEAVAPALFTDAIPSWNAVTPGDSAIEIEVRVRHGGQWSQFYRIAHWDDRLEQSSRHSFDSQRDEIARVATDTLIASGPCDAIQARILLIGNAAVSALYLALSAPTETVSQPLPHIAEMTVPLRSQMIYPVGGSGWCSPTCVTMLLAYWHNQLNNEQLAAFLPLEAVPERAVKLIYDPAYDGTGNWTFNTAAAASVGLESYVARFASLNELSPWLQAGVPVVISISWKEGELDGAAIPKSNGHLIVVTGFDGDGGVYVADPAWKNAEQVRQVYRADQLEVLWQRNSQGTSYIIYPPRWIGVPSR